MTVVLLKRLPPAVSIRLFPAAMVDPWINQGLMPPIGWAVDTQVTSAIGEVSFDVADNQEFLAVSPDATGRRVMSAVTQGGSTPWAPAV